MWGGRRRGGRAVLVDCTKGVPSKHCGIEKYSSRSVHCCIFRLKTEMCDASPGKPHGAQKLPSRARNVTNVTCIFCFACFLGWWMVGVCVVIFVRLFHNKQNRERTLCFAYCAKSSRAPMVSLNLSECVNFPTHTPRDTSWSRETLVARFMISSRT